MSLPLEQPAHEYTFEEYLELERHSEEKHEFHGGVIQAMSGGTARHSALAARVIMAAGTTLPRGCTVFTSDMRVRVAETDRAMYPDVSMVWGPIEYDAGDPAKTTITNPVLIVEVLSKTTEIEDRVSKWMHYQRIPQLQEYVLVSQEPRIEIYRRTAGGSWEYLDVREGSVSLASGPTLELSAVYADLPE